MGKRVVGYTLGPVYPKGAVTTEKPAPVHELDKSQEKALKRRVNLENFVKNTEERLGNLQKQLAEIQSTCTHPVFKDRDMYPYYYWECEICGQHIDTI